MFRFIHTSDWHLGQNFYGYDRNEEQRDMLRQLADIVADVQPDALLVSGDIYHTAAPSSAAVSLYVEAMLEIHRACPTMSIIVIAGNHDSASRLESHGLLWRLAGVTVLGGITRNTEGKADLSSHLIRVGDKGIVAAVPFAFPPSFPLTDEDIERGGRQPAYFQALLDQANQQNPDGLPVVLMAHLAVSNSDTTGHDHILPMECVDLTTLGRGYDYAALGHIHRPQAVGSNARYCGTPLAVSFDEQCEHSVSLVEIESHGSTPVVTARRINNIKPLHTIPADHPVPLDDAIGCLQRLSPAENAYIRLNVLVEQTLPHDAQSRAAQAAQEMNCRYCDIKKTLPATIARQERQMTLEELNSMLPADVANRYFIDKTGHPMTQEQQEMFNTIYQQVLEENRQS